MKVFLVRCMASIALVSVMGIGNNTYSQLTEKDAEREHIRKHKPAVWPAQVITSKQEHISAPRVVNMQDILAYQAAHPKPSRTGFITQIEDKDADFKFVPHTIPAGTPTFDPDTLGHGGHRHTANASQHLANSPAPLGYFLGTDGNGSLVPPDIAGAAGPTYVMETNNQQFEIYTKAGVHNSTIDIDNFFTGGVTGGYFDPHIVYDNFNNHFIVVIDGNINSNNDGGLFIAVSQTSDPTGSWWTYDIDNGDANTNDLLDYPQIGYNKNWFVITDNDFVGSNVTEDIYIMSIASLESGTLGTVTHSTDNNAFSIGPAQTMDNTTNTLWLVQDGNGGSGAMQIGSITGTVAAPVYNAGFNISTTSAYYWNENAVDIEQLGGGTTQLINDDDTRIGNGCVFANGQLWFTHAIWLPATGTATNAGVDWWEVNPTTQSTTQFGRIASPTNGATVVNYYYPTLAVNSNGDALLGYCVSGADSFYASAAYSFRAGTDPVNTMQQRYIYKAGTAAYYQTLGGTRNRYGDYTGTVVDPSDQSFWNFSEWAYTSTYWGTVIAHVAAATPPTNPPVASFTASQTLVSCNGLVDFTDESTNDPTSWHWSFGDGDTSDVQNPSHQYTTNGTYTISLKATNAYGNNTQTLTSYITVSLPAAPTAASQSRCGTGTFSLSASTTDPVAWFNSAGTQVSSANPFVTPSLTTTTTYYVQDSVYSPVDSFGPAAYNTLGTGAYFASTNQHYLTFDALSDFTLISVVVRASTAGARTIQLINSGGTVIATASPNIPTGVSTVTLNFSVPEGTGYELSCGGTGTTNIELYRNSAVVAGAFPFTLANVASITGSDVGTGYYYYFYDWKVQAAPCVSERTTVTATVYPAVAATATPTQVACFGGATGEISVSVTTGTPTYSYAWSGSHTGNPLTGLIAGTYTVTVTDAHSCSTTLSETLSQPTALSVTGTVVNVSCTSANSGSIAAAVTGGTTTYSYLWSTTPQQTTATATALTAGSYTVTVTDAHSCSTTKSFTVGGASGGLSTSTTSVNATCGSSNGTATVNVTPTGTYTYHWNAGTATTSATDLGLAAGTYTVTVSNAGGCSATASVSVNSTGGPSVSSTDVATTCGNNNGSAHALVTSGSGPFTYLWNNAQTDSIITGLASGSYTVTVKDVNGCASISSVTVAASNGVTLTHAATATTCGLNNGTASVSITNPVNPTYSWSGGLGTTASISGVASGTYTVTVNSNGCSATASVSVAASTGVTLTPASTASTCGQSNGTASVTVSNPVSPTYNWSGGLGTTSSISGLGAGTYTVTVDNNGCSATASVSVSASSGPSLSTTSAATSCGQNNGTATVSVTNPVNPTYSWSGGAGSTATVTGLAAGTYTVTVNSNGCSATASVSVGASSGPSVTSNSIDAVCASLNGSASVTVANPSNPTYVWSGGLGTTSSISGVAAGTYTVTVTNGGSCSAVVSVTVGQSSGTLAVSPNPSSEPCYGDALGTAAVNVTGGTPNYSYNWSTSQSSSSVTGLTAGIYTVTVSDASGCTTTASVRVSQPNPLGTAITVTQPGGGATTGSAVIDSVTGGTKPFTIVWSSGQLGDSSGALVPGTYTVTVTDSDRCKAVDTVVIKYGTGVTNVNGGINFSIYPNPANTSVTVDLQNTYDNATISLRDIIGQTLMSRELTVSSVTLDLGAYASGVYFIEVAQGGKTAVRKLVINK